MPDLPAEHAKPGDTVLISGTVIETRPTVGVLVELFSKTDQYQAWIRHDLVTAVVLPDPPDEPDAGTWVVDQHNDDGGISVYHRDDTGAPDEPERRWPRHWQVAGTGEWIDWPTVIARGGRPDQQLAPSTGDPDA